jgi:predicted kinase
VPAYAIVLDLDGEAVRRQNAGRSRVVDSEVIDRHLAAVRQAVDRDRLASEGFDEIVVLDRRLRSVG